MKTIIILIVLTFINFYPGAAFAKGDKITEAFGMNIHLRQRFAQSDWETIMQAAETAGVQWGREEFNWDVLEPSDGTFDFSQYDAVVQTYASHNIKVMGLLTYSSSWAAAKSFDPPAADAWQNYVATVATHYAGQIDTWEIWNEPNYAAFWSGSAADYALLLNEAATAIKAVNPNATVVLGGLSGADSNYLDTIYANLSDPTIIDVVAIHPYRTADNYYIYSPESTVTGLNTLQTDLYNVLAVMQRHGQTSTPLWLTELGWPTLSNTGVTDSVQAQYLMRAYTIALSIPAVQKVFWYALSDTNDGEFGLMNTDNSVKPAYSAYQFMTQYFDQQRFHEQILPSSNTISDFSQSAGWRFADTLCTDGTLNDHDSGKLTVNYQFTADTNCYGPIHFGKTLPNPTRVVQFRAKGQTDDTLLRLRVIDASGETFQYNLGFMPNKWLYYSVHLKQYSSHWNGNNDGVLDQPLQFDSFILDDTDGSMASGTVKFDDVSSSQRANTFIYRFRADGHNNYAFWTSGNSKTVSVNTGDDMISIDQWQHDTVTQAANDGIYALWSSPALKWLH